ncbi:hemocytin [Trichonephila clavipes]|nr:hemocytin [Trichonephila clavipes]
MITNFFIPELNNHDVQELWFQQDGTTCHTARATIDLLKDTFGDRLISRFGPVNWPPRSCDLTLLDYFLWGYVKSLVYAGKPQTLDHLEDNIRRVITDIRPPMLEKVIENWTSRLDYIRASRGSPISEIIFKMCVSDACACSTGGDCKCVCAVIAAYALKCARSGVVIPWRSQDLCPVQCESCDRYSPCISLCQPVNCDTYLIPLESQSCSREYCVDGCEPKPCKPGHVHRSATNLTCIPEEMCDDKPCVVIDGVSYREGERIENPDVGDSCQSCYCKNGKVDCIGVPCTYSTLQPIPTFIEEEPCEFTGWTEWINSMDPNDNDGNDFENLKELVETHRIPCPLDHVRGIECRSVETQEPAEATGQNVTCNPTEGLLCRRKARTGDCDDYEIRVYCQCHEEVTCPPQQEWKECAFDCENSCHSLATDLSINSMCTEGQKCASGCVKTPCQLPLVSRDAESCVTPDQCTCRLETGFILAPGQVITNGCEKCQCLNNTLICSTTLDCKQPEKVLDELGPYSENVPYIEVVTLKPHAKLPKPATRIIGPTRRKPSTPSSRGLVLASTTPACSYWSNWINKAKPKKGRKHGEKEDTRPYIVKQTEGFFIHEDASGHGRKLMEGVAEHGSYERVYQVRCRFCAVSARSILKNLGVTLEPSSILKKEEKDKSTPSFRK